MISTIITFISGWIIGIILGGIIAFNIRADDN